MTWFPFGEPVLRDRPPQIPDPRNPVRTIPGPFDTDDMVTITLEDAYLASSSSVAITSESRTQIITAKSLYCPGDSDVQPGDRIRSGGFAYFVTTRPQADMNPFTGWRPPMEVPLTLWEG